MVQNPGYDFNDDIITIGATLFARLVERTPSLISGEERE